MSFYRSTSSLAPVDRHFVRACPRDTSDAASAPEPSDVTARDRDARLAAWVHAAMLVLAGVIAWVEVSVLRLLWA